MLISKSGTKEIQDFSEGKRNGFHAIAWAAVAVSSE